MVTESLPVVGRDLKWTDRKKSKTDILSKNELVSLMQIAFR